MNERIMRMTALLLMLAVGSLAAAAFGPKFYWMKSEYITAGVIQSADEYVTQHPGQWPKSWSDLGGEDLSRHTEFRFDLTPEQIVLDRELIYTAIQPRSRKYRTYPHARRQLDALYKKLTANKTDE